MASRNITLSITIASLLFLARLEAFSYEYSIESALISSEPSQLVKPKSQQVAIPLQGFHEISPASAIPEAAPLVAPEDNLSCWTPSCNDGAADVSGSPFLLFQDGSRLKLSGWAESGLYTNSWGATSKYDSEGLIGESGNGQIHGPGLSTTNYNLNQLWGRFAREMDCENGLDWGFQTDVVYGMGGYEIQSFGDDSFDTGWGSGDYGFGLYQLYAELGYKKLSAKYGKFGTPLGWEETASWDNFFYSHSYCYNIEPSTHLGALLNYELTDNLKLVGGWTCGIDSGFANRYGDQSFLGGLELSLGDKATIYYYMTQGKLKNGVDASNNFRFASGLDTDFFIQSVAFECLLTDQLTYVLQYNLNNMNEVGGERFSGYGINNHLIYQINDKWGIGVRAEWFRDNGSSGYTNFAGDSINSDYVEATLGLNFNPTEYIRIRPEIRYDYGFSNTIFNEGTKHQQLSGGFAVLLGF